MNSNIDKANLSWLACNSCFKSYLRDKIDIYVTNCGHLLCNNCKHMSNEFILTNLNFLGQLVLKPFLPKKHVLFAITKFKSAC